MNALKQGLQMEPSFPKGFPARRAIAAAGKEATQASYLRPKRPECHVGSILARACCQHHQKFRRNDLGSRTLRFLTGKRTQLQQAHGHGRQKPQQTHQALGTLDLTLLNATSRFEALVIVFHDPSMLIPRGAFPSLFQGPRVAQRDETKQANNNGTEKELSSVKKKKWSEKAKEREESRYKKRAS